MVSVLFYFITMYFFIFHIETILMHYGTEHKNTAAQRTDYTFYLEVFISKF